MENIHEATIVFLGLSALAGSVALLSNRILAIVRAIKALASELPLKKNGLITGD